MVYTVDSQYLKLQEDGEKSLRYQEFDLSRSWF